MSGGELDAPGISAAECVGRRSLEAALLKYFKYTSFRPGQLNALLPLVHGRDVFVRMATGAGKSLCMFLAPLAIGESAIGVIISPLNALMDQQVLHVTDIDNYNHDGAILYMTYR